MARVIVIRITVDNREAINAVKLQREEQKKLNEQIAASGKETRAAEAHMARMSKTQAELSHVQQGLTNSFIKGNLAARAISETYINIRDSVRFAIGESAKFELTMARVSAVTGSTKNQTGALADTVFSLSRNVAASTNEISAAALELAKLGFSGENLKAVLGGVAQLSSVLGDSLEATGQLVGGVVNAFNLSSEEATKVADKLFVATGRSATNIEGFKVAFSLASAVAEDAGIKFEEFAAAVAALSNQGIRASTIGTGLRNFIAELSKEGSKAQKALGGSIEELGLLGAMEKLNQLQLKPGSLIDLFGKPGSPVASGLTNARTQYLEFLDAITNSEGALKKGGETINDTLISSITLLKNSFLEFFSISTSPQAKAFQSYLENIGEGIRKASDAQRKENAFQAFLKQAKTDGVRPEDVLGIKESDNRFLSATTEQLRAAFERRELLRKSREIRGPNGRDEMSFFDRTSPLVNQPTAPNKITSGIIDPLKAAKAELQDIKTALQKFDTKGTAFNFEAEIKHVDTLVATFEKLGASKEAEKALLFLKDLKKQFETDPSIYRGVPTEFEEDAARVIEDDPKQFEKFLKGKAAFEARQEKEKKKLFEADKFKVFIRDLEESVEPVQVLIDNLTLSMDALGSSTQIFGDLIVDSFLGHADAFSDFQDAFGNMAKRFISDLIAMELRILAFKTALKIFGLFTAAAASPALAPGAPDLLGAGGGVTLAANGFDGVVTGPRLFLAGEGGEPERVKITPMSKMGQGESGGNTYITVQGDVFDSEKLVDKIALTNERTRTRYV
jgi:TP901 family phage tail tape measure protein